jgi:hypothetical protein
MPTPRNPPWWHDQQRRRLLVALCEEQQRACAARGRRLTWEETANGVRVYVDGRYDSTITLEEIRALEAAVLQDLYGGPDDAAS